MNIILKKERYSLTHYFKHYWLLKVKKRRL